MTNGTADPPRQPEIPPLLTPLVAGTGQAVGEYLKAALKALAVATELLLEQNGSHSKLDPSIKELAKAMFGVLNEQVHDVVAPAAGPSAPTAAAGAQSTANPPHARG